MIAYIMVSSCFNNTTINKKHTHTFKINLLFQLLNVHCGYMNPYKIHTEVYVYEFHNNTPTGQIVLDIKSLILLLQRYLINRSLIYIYSHYYNK